MSHEKSDLPFHKKQILFIFPLVYQPQKVNFAERYTLLSRWYKGHIFALSGGQHRYLPISDFFIHSEKFSSNDIIRFFRGLWLQIFVPLQLFWGKSQVEAVVAYDPYRSGFAALVLKYLLRCKMIVEVNGEYHTDYEKNEAGQTYAKKIFMSLLSNLVLRRADAIKVLNNDQEAFIRRFLPHKTIYRFPNFVATKYFQSLEGYQGNYFLSIGHPFHRKGMDVLIKAFKLVAEKYPQVRLRIMGYCPNDELERYKAIASDHPQIAFIKPGWIEDVGEQMRGCYAFVSAARSEAMGRVLIEAMACGKPIVASRTSGGMQCIEDDQTGLLCAVEDVEGLAAKLDKLLLDPEYAERMGRAGKVRMQHMFSEKAYGERFRTMLEKVLQSSNCQ